MSTTIFQWSHVRTAQTLAESAEESDPARPRAVAATALENRNIYNFILDTYTRADMLRIMVGYDNEPFIDTLRAKGFVVVDDSYSNYPWTTLSLSSSLSMDYIVQPGTGRPYDSTRFAHMIGGDNELIRTLKASGYNYVSYNSGRYRTTLGCSGIESLYLQCDGMLTESEILLLSYTPAAHIIRKFFPVFYSSWSSGCRLSALPDKLWPYRFAKVFLFAHDMALHDEMFVDSDCRPLPADSPRDWNQHAPSRQMHMQIDCINRELTKMIDGIISSDPRAIILISGDHGFWPAKCDDCDDANDDFLKTRHAIFTALRLPEACRTSVPSNLSPVNHYRLILACLEGKAPDLLPNRYFWVKESEAGNNKIDVVGWSPE